MPFSLVIFLMLTSATKYAIAVRYYFIRIFGQDKKLFFSPEAPPLLRGQATSPAGQGQPSSRLSASLAFPTAAATVKAASLDFPSTSGLFFCIFHSQ